MTQVMMRSGTPASKSGTWARADDRALTGLDVLLARESMPELRRAVSIDARLRLARRRLRGIKFTRRTAVQQQVLARIIALLEPNRRPDLILALRAIAAERGGISFKAASRYIAAEWSLKMSDHTFADLWRRMLTALAPRPSRVEPQQVPRRAAPPANLIMRLRARCRVTPSHHRAADSFPGSEFDLVAVMCALLHEEQQPALRSAAAGAERLRKAARHLAEDLARVAS